MGNLGDIFGATDNRGMNFQADRANVVQPVDQGQTNAAYDQSQLGIQRQMDFLNHLANQGGVGNQANVFAQQQALANQIQDYANGAGPDPAMRQLQLTTGQNVANQAALMAGQRGSSSNAGLLARQIAQQGANTQQQAVGQGALLGAQQQWSAINALQNQQNMLGGLATQQVGQQANALGLYNQAAQSQEQNLLNATAQNNNANIGMQSNLNNTNAQIAGLTAHGQQGAIQGLSGGLGSVLGGSISGAQGGMVVQHYADGGMAGPQSYAGRFLFGSAPSNTDLSTPNVGMVASIEPPPSSDNGKNPYKGIFQAAKNGMMSSGSSDAAAAGSEGAAIDASSGMGDLADSASLFAAKGGQIPSKKMLHMDAGGMIETAVKLIPIALAMLNKGGIPPVDGEALANQGKMIPGQAAVKGNSLKNDKIPAMLSPKEIVIPRSITMSPNAPEKAKAFVAAILAKNGMRKK